MADSIQPHPGLLVEGDEPAEPRNPSDTLQVPVNPPLPGPFVVPPPVPPPTYPVIKIRAPTPYCRNQQPSFPPSQAWMCGTWSVAYSTLGMWKQDKQNVRITYKAYRPFKYGRAMENLVEYERIGKPGVRTVKGIEKQGPNPNGWTWRGKGWLKVISSYWEVLGYGERAREFPAANGDQVEKWMVIWFRGTPVTAEGMDILVANKEGLSDGLLDDIVRAMKHCMDAPKIISMTKQLLERIPVSLPWQEREQE
ncbi:hypothetical protein F4778DRAFT_444374 [Xylariomycetidae sp. FL2044]|nr:hypothetical protein F4778DRAFT_444374 [Xylariomycetidae sp. FL2044]